MSTPTLTFKQACALRTPFVAQFDGSAEVFQGTGDGVLYHGYVTTQATPTFYHEGHWSLLHYVVVDWFEPGTGACECGSRAIGGLAHSHWCPQAEVA